jgi:hypothetical protein
LAGSLPKHYVQPIGQLGRHQTELLDEVRVSTEAGIPNFAFTISDDDKPVAAAVDVQLLVDRERGSFLVSQLLIRTTK